MIFVAFDSATYTVLINPGAFCLDCTQTASPYTSTHHVGYLYYLWGVPVGVLLVQAGRVLREAHRSSLPNRLSRLSSRELGGEG